VDSTNDVLVDERLAKKMPEESVGDGEAVEESETVKTE
jgi:hypothetical protein